MEELIEQKKGEIEALHEAVEACIAKRAPNADALREYKGKVNQYLDMYETFETMKRQSDKADTKEGLNGQIIVLLDQWIAFETFAKKQWS